MARFRLKHKGRFTRNAKEKVNRAIRRSGLMQDIRDDLVKDMKSGLNPKTGQPYKSLKKSTIEKRRKMSKYNLTDPKFSAAKSNLTFSGQLLNSIEGKIQVTQDRIVIEPKGSRRPYKTKSGRPVKGKKISNKKLAKIHSEGKGNLPKRDVLAISKKRIEDIKKKIRKAVKKQFS